MCMFNVQNCVVKNRIIILLMNYSISIIIIITVYCECLVYTFKYTYKNQSSFHDKTYLLSAFLSDIINTFVFKR